MGELMSLEEIAITEHCLAGADFRMQYLKGSVPTVFETARAAHEWKKKYESLQLEKSWSYENAAQAAALALENERLKEQLLTARAEERERAVTIFESVCGLFSIDGHVKVFYSDSLLAEPSQEPER